MFFFFLEQSQVTKKYSKLFEELDSEFKDVREGIESIVGYSADYFEPPDESKLDEVETLLFFLSEGKLAERETLLETQLSVAYMFYYHKSVSKLNELRSQLAALKHMEEMNDERN